MNIVEYYKTITNQRLVVREQPSRPAKPGHKWVKTPKGNWEEVKIKLSPEQQKTWDEIKKLIKHYEDNPRGKNQGNCHNAVRDIARKLTEFGVKPKDMTVLQIQTADKEGKQSNHVVLKVDDSKDNIAYFDPTGTQYSHIHGGKHNSIVDKLPAHYKVHKEIPIDQYLKKKESLVREDHQEKQLRLMVRNLIKDLRMLRKRKNRDKSKEKELNDNLHMLFRRLKMLRMTKKRRF